MNEITLMIGPGGEISAIGEIKKAESVYQHDTVDIFSSYTTLRVGRVPVFESQGYTFRTLPAEALLEVEALRELEKVVYKAMEENKNECPFCYADIRERYDCTGCGANHTGGECYRDGEHKLDCRAVAVLSHLAALREGVPPDIDMNQVMAAKQAQKDGTMIPIKDILREGKQKDWGHGSACSCGDCHLKDSKSKREGSKKGGGGE